MSTLADRLRAIIEVLPDTAAVTLPVAVLRGWLEAEEAPAADPAIDATVIQTAARLNRAPSTVRTWLSLGLFPGAYRLRGREWRIPAAAIAAFQRAEAHRAADTMQPVPNDEDGDLGAWRRSA